MNQSTNPGGTTAPGRAGMLSESMRSSLRSISLDDTDALTVSSRVSRLPSTDALPTIEFEDEEENAEESSSTTKHSHDSLSPQVYSASAFQEKVNAKSAKCSILLHGQIVSILTATMMGIQVSMHSNCRSFAPAFVGMFAYLIRCLHLIPLLCRADIQLSMKNARRGERVCFNFCGILPLANPIWLHFLVAIVSVESYSFAMLAIQYTTVSSVATFDAAGIPIVMILSRCLVSRRYQCLHITGTIICLMGLSLNTLQEYQTSHEEITVQNPPTFRHIQQLGELALVTVQRKTTEESVPLLTMSSGHDPYPNRVLGDVLAVFAGVLGGLVDISSEHMIRTSGNVNEYLGVVGFLAALISAAKVVAFERQVLGEYFSGLECSREMAASLLGGCVLAFYLQSEAMARFLRNSEAALLNLSVLTCDIYRTIFILMAEHFFPLPLFWVGIFLIVLGIFVYELDPTPTIGTVRNISPSPSPPPGEIPLDIHVGNPQQKRWEKKC